MKINKFAAIIVVLALIILLFGLFLYEDIRKANPNINNQVNQPNMQVMTITVRKADNTTETAEIEVEMPVILTVQE